MIDSSETTNYMIPIFPRQREVFYSSIPVKWTDVPEQCEVCLPCARDTFTAPTESKLTVATTAKL